MKQFFIILLIIVLVIVGFMLFGKQNQEEQIPQASPEAVTLEEGVYTLENDGVLSWRGHKPLLDNYFDSGVVTVSEGTLSVSNTTSGTFVIDMTTITGEETSNTDRGVDMLTNHLKSGDWFDVENHPTATFTVTSLESAENIAGNYIATGDLTIKGITNEISLPLTFSYLDETTLRVVGSTTLDRSLWDIRFGSASFFNDLADGVISDDMDISFDLALTKTE